jgi:hypothetical protein
MDILINKVARVTNPVSREQEGNTNQDYWGAQKADLYGSMASNMTGDDLGAILENR